MLFKDWKLLDQTSVGFNLEKQYVYYIHSRAWALKGWLGGTHSWTTFWSEEHNKWLVIELTDRETINVQKATIFCIKDNTDYLTKTPIISDRVPDSLWFGTTPIIVGKSLNTFTYVTFVELCLKYPITNFRIVNRNCNTFTSYIISTLDLSIKKPFRSIGFKNRCFWLRIW